VREALEGRAVVKAGKYRVVYQVKFECEVVLDADDHWEDKLSDIDVPEGGENNSTYCQDSFKILEHEESKGEQR
jgi:hypothetical protein